MDKQIILQLSVEEADLLFYLSECYSIGKTPTPDLWKNHVANEVADKLDERLEDALGED